MAKPPRTLDQVDADLADTEGQLRKLTRQLRKLTKGASLDHGKGVAGRVVKVRVRGKTVTRAVASNRIP